MSLQCLRPLTRDLRFQVFKRSIHPELFESLKSRRIVRNGVVMTARLLAEGHVVEFRTDDVTITETVCTRVDLFSSNHELTNSSLLNSRHEQFLLSPKAKFHIGYHAEVLDEGQFKAISEEIAADSRKATISCILDSGGHSDLMPLSYLNIDAVPGAVIVQAFHTYPEERAVLRTQSLLEMTAND